MYSSITALSDSHSSDCAVYTEIQCYIISVGVQYVSFDKYCRSLKCLATPIFETEAASLVYNVYGNGRQSSKIMFHICHRPSDHTQCVMQLTIGNSCDSKDHQNNCKSKQS